MLRGLLLLFATNVIVCTSSAQLKSPEEFLGYELGEAFSRHHQVWLIISNM